jgi:hypothetical protein
MVKKGWTPADGPMDELWTNGRGQVFGSMVDLLFLPPV